jgi:biotin carboxylase
LTRLLVLHPRLADLRRADLGRYRLLLKTLGLHLVLADHRPDPEQARHFHSVLELPPPQAVDACWECLRRYLERAPVDALLALGESALPLGALAQREFGLRGASPEAAYACLDKHATRLRLAAAGVSQPEFRLVGDHASARGAARELGYPLVLKACASAKQRLVTLVRHEEELAPAVARLAHGLPRSRDVERLVSFARVARLELSADPWREFLVEAFAPGDPLESDGLVVGGEVASFDITEQIHAREPCFFIEGYLTPADRPASEIERLEELTRAAVAAVGLADGGYSIEFRSGPRGSRLIEINGRLGCDEGFGDLFEAVLGAHPVYLALRAALGHRTSFRRGPGRAAVAYRCSYERGEVVAVPEPRELARLERAGVEIGVNVRPGERTRDASDPEVHPHLAFVLARDPTSSRAAFERARRIADGLAFELEPSALVVRGT